MATNIKDTGNIFRSVYDSDTESLKTLLTGGSLVPEKFDELALTYVTSGDGLGEIQTVTYKLNGNTIATLTLTYNVSSKLIGVVRS